MLRFKGKLTEAAKYPVGSTITQAQADALFDVDFNKREITGLTQSQNEALTSWTFNSASKASYTVKKYNNTPVESREMFILDNIRAKPIHLKGLAKRRSAEFIVFQYGRYFNLDFSKNAQSKWRNIYNTLTAPPKEDTKANENSDGK